MDTDGLDVGQSGNPLEMDEERLHFQRIVSAFKYYK